MGKLKLGSITIADTSDVSKAYVDGEILKITSAVWTGTEAEWDELTSEEQSSYTIALITE